MVLLSLGYIRGDIKRPVDSVNHSARYRKTLRRARNLFRFTARITRHTWAGKGKARFFVSHGFAVEDWQKLADALRQHARDHEITKEETTPRFVIAYPLKRKKQV